MIKTEEIRRRAERVMRGTGSSADLHQLFLWLRRRSFGNRAIEDVGDFVAHADAREKGAAQKGVQAFTTMLDFHLFPSGMERSRRTYNEFRETARATFEAMGPEEVRRLTGLGQSKAKAALARGLKNIFELNGKFVFAQGTPADERKLVNLMTSVIVSKPAFNDGDLERQFVAALVKNNLVERPRQVVSGLQTQLAIFALLTMHMTAVVLQTGESAPLYAGRDERYGKGLLGVYALVPLPGVPNRQARSMIYETSLAADEWCDPILLQIQDWRFPLEIGPSGKLQMLT